MSIQRWATKIDSTQREIVEGLRAAGVKVWIIKQPVDLLCWVFSQRLGEWVWRPLEVKTPYGKRAPKPRVRNDQKAQQTFVAETRTPVVSSLSEALTALEVQGTSARCSSIHSSVTTISVVAR